MREKIISILFNSISRIDSSLSKESSWISKDCLNEYRYFMLCTNFLPASAPLKERVFCFIHNLTAVPVCSKCGKPKKFLTKNYSSKCECQNLIKVCTTCVSCGKEIIAIQKYEGFPYTCSRACINSNADYDQLLIDARGYPRGYHSVEEYQNSLNIETRECNVCGSSFECRADSLQKSCSHTCANKSPERIEKIKEYHLNNADTLLEKRQATCVKKYGIKSSLQLREVIEKRQNTCLEKYGATNYLASKQAEEHRRQILLEQFGVDNYFKRRDLVVEAWSKKYGQYTTSPQQIEHVKQKTLETVRSTYGEVWGCMPRQQVEQTCLERYGATSFFASEAGRMTYENLKKRYGWTDEELAKLARERNKQSRCGRASKESLVYFVPLYNFLMKQGFADDDIMFGYNDKKELLLFSVAEDEKIIKGLYDFAIVSLKAIIEYHGEKFHPRLDLLTEEELEKWENPYTKQRWQEQYQRDKEKKTLAVNSGFNYYELWSSNSYKENFNIIKQLLEQYSIDYTDLTLGE